MEDLRGFTRDLARRMEADLGTRLDWVAVDHWNTDNPHVHLIVRGVDDRGGDLVIARDYISSGLRSRAEDLVALELGPKPEHEIRHALEQEVTAERWTSLDREIRYRADDLGLIDLRPETRGPEDPADQAVDDRPLAAPRKTWPRLRGPPRRMDAWDSRPRRTLRDLGERGDIIKTMHRAFAAREDRTVASQISSSTTAGRATRSSGGWSRPGCMTNRLAWLMPLSTAPMGARIMSVSAGCDAFDHAPHPGGIVEVRRFGGPDDPRPDSCPRQPVRSRSAKPDHRARRDLA